MSAPAKKQIGSVKSELNPLLIKAAVMAAPIGKLPSTVKSGKSRILYVIYTPNAMIA